MILPTRFTWAGSLVNRAASIASGLDHALTPAAITARGHLPLAGQAVKPRGSRLAPHNGPRLGRCPPSRSETRTPRGLLYRLSRSRGEQAPETVLTRQCVRRTLRRSVIHRRSSALTPGSEAIAPSRAALARRPPFHTPAPRLRASPPLTLAKLRPLFRMLI